MAPQQIDQAELVKALDYLKELHPKVQYRSKNGRRFLEFPPGTSEQACQYLTLLGKADQTVHQVYLPTAVQHQVSVVRNLYASK